MIEMISLRNFRLATTRGHILFFKANTPRMVPSEVVQEAQAAGCVPTNQADQQFIDDSAAAKVEFVGSMRRSLLFLAMDVVARTNDVKEFDGSGKPKIEALSKRLGFDVTAKERTSVWQEYLSAKNSDSDPNLHPDAETAMRVLMAGDLEELRDIAVELGVSQESADGLTSRELRKMLLARYSGITAG